MAGSPNGVDYAALAKQAGAIGSSQPPVKSVDYAALAKQAGSIGSEDLTPKALLPPKSPTMPMEFQKALETPMPQPGRLNISPPPAIDKATGKIVSTPVAAEPPPPTPSLLDAASMLVPGVGAYREAGKLAAQRPITKLAEAAAGTIENRPERQFTNALVGLGLGGADVLEGLATPENASLIAGMMVLPVAGIGGAIHKLVSLGFSYQMAKNAVDEFSSAYDAYKNGADLREVIRGMTGGAASTVLSALAAKGLASRPTAAEQSRANITASKGVVQPIPPEIPVTPPPFTPPPAFVPPEIQQAVAGYRAKPKPPAAPIFRDLVPPVEPAAVPQAPAPTPTEPVMPAMQVPPPSVPPRLIDETAPKPAPPPAPKDLSQVPIGEPKEPVLVDEARKHGKVVGIDATTKLPIIDTSKPAEAPVPSAPSVAEGVTIPQAPEVAKPANLPSEKVAAPNVPPVQQAPAAPPPITPQAPEVKQAPVHPERRFAPGRPVLDRLESISLDEFMQRNPTLSREDALRATLEAREMGKESGKVPPPEIQARIDSQMQAMGFGGKPTLRDLARSDQDYGVISWEKSDLSPEENLQRTRELSSRLQQLGLQSFPTRGEWTGGGEDSFVVPGITHEQLVALGKEGRQDAVISKQGLTDLNTGVIQPLTDEPFLTGEKARKTGNYTIDSDGIPVAMKFGEAPREGIKTLPPTPTNIPQVRPEVKENLPGPPSSIAAAAGITPTKTQIPSAGAPSQLDLFFHDAEQKARRRIAARAPLPETGGISATGVKGGAREAEISDRLKDWSIIGASQMWKFGRDRQAWGERMVSEIGEEVRPHLGKLYGMSSVYLKDQVGSLRRDADEEFPWLSKKEASYFTPEQKKAMSELFNRLPSVEQLTAAAQAGAAGKDWYRPYAPVFKELLGEDYETFTHVLAATSPQIAVRKNLMQSLDFYSRWVDMDRPTDPAVVKGIMAQAGMVIRTNINNVITALEQAGPGRGPIQLSGPKVTSFVRNLLGERFAATLDGWMALAGNLNPRALEGRALGGETGLPRPAYVALTSRVREVSKKLGWDPDQAQAAIWSFVKTLGDLAGLSQSYQKPLSEISKLVTPKMIGEHVKNADFVQLILHDKEVQDAIKRAVGEEPLGRAQGAAQREATKAEGFKTFTKAPNPRVLEQLTTAIDREGRERLHERILKKSTEVPELFRNLEPGEILPSVTRVKGSELESLAREKLGTTDDIKKAGYILQDGTLIPVKDTATGTIHSSVLNFWPGEEGRKLRAGEAADKADMGRVYFLDRTGALRMGYRPRGLYERVPELYVSVPRKGGITEVQLDRIQQAVGAFRGASLVLETSDPKGGQVFKHFVQVSDVQPALKQLGVPIRDTRAATVGSLAAGINPAAIVKAFKPIPQADTGLEGTPNNPSPMDRIEAARIAGLKGPKFSVKEAWRKTTDKYYDFLLRWNSRVEDFEKREGIKLPTAENPYRVGWLVQGGAGGPMEVVVGKYRSVALSAYKKGDLKAVTQLLDLYGYRRAINILIEKQTKAVAEGDTKLAKELGEKIDLRNVVPEKYGHEEIATDLKKMQQTLPLEQMMRAKASAEKIWKLQREAWDLLRHGFKVGKHRLGGGIISDEIWHQGINRGPEYIPLQRILQGLDRSHYQVGGATLNLPERHSLHYLEGSELVNVNPIEASMQQHVITIKDVARNWAAKSFIEFAERDVNGLGKEVYELRSGEKPKRGLDEIAFWEDGKKRRFAVPELLAAAAKSVDAEPMRIVGTAALRASQGLFRLGATGANLAFIATNPIRDIQPTMTFEAGPKRFRDLPGFMRDYGTALNERLWNDPKWEDFQNSFGSFSGLQRQISTSRFLSEEIPGLRPESLPSSVYKFARSKTIGNVETLNDVLETAPKAMAYDRAIQEGKDPLDAAWIGRRWAGSPDFARRGTVSPLANLLLMFFNARLQGIGRTIEGTAKNPKRVAKALVTLTAMQTALTTWNHQWQDPDGGKTYSRVTDMDRNNYFVIIAPWLEQTNDGDIRHAIYRIPKDHMFQVLFNPIQDALDAAFGDKRSAVQSALDVAGNMAPIQMNPKKGEVLPSVVRGAVSTLNPALREPLEQFAKTDTYRGMPMVPHRFEGGSPEFEQTPTTSPVAVAFSKLAQKIPGLREIPWFTSPLRSQHLIRGFGAGLGEQLLALKESPAAELVPRNVSQWPIVGPVLSRFKGSQVNQALRDKEESFYNLYRQANEVATNARNLEASKPEEAAKYREEHDILLTAQPLLSQMSEMLSGIQREQENIVYDKALSREEKQKQRYALFRDRKDALMDAAQMAEDIQKDLDKETTAKVKPTSSVPTQLLRAISGIPQETQNAPQ